MGITRDDTVRDIVAGDFRAAAVLHRYGINFCCGGARTLDEACRDHRLDGEDVMAEIGRACACRDTDPPPFSQWEPETLIAYIVGNHHAYLRATLPAIAAHTQKLASSHGDRYPAVREIADVVEGFVADLTSHLAKEENILFPYIVGVADAVRRGSEMPLAPFGRIDSPIRMMEAEHEAAGAAMDRLRTLTGGFAPAPDACMTHRVCLQELEALDRDLRTHMSIENIVLFPKTRKLVQAAGC